MDKQVIPMTYVTITEEQFDAFITPLGYSPIQKEGVKEKVYAKYYSDVYILIYSTLENGITRDVGTDAIKSLITSKSLNMAIGGTTKTLRTGTVESVLARLSQKLTELESKAIILDTIYSKLPIYTFNTYIDLAAHIDQIVLILTGTKKGKTNNGDPKIRVTFRTNCMKPDTTPYFISFTTKTDNIEDIIDLTDTPGHMYQIISMTNKVEDFESRSGCYITLGDYGFIWNKRDLYLTDLDDSEMSKLPEPKKIPKSIETPLINTSDDPCDNCDEYGQDCYTCSSNKEELTIPDNNLTPTTETYLKDKYTFSLNPMQDEVWQSNAIQNGDNLIVASPTASGKTLVAELAIIKSLNDLKPAIYLTPMKALAEEKYTDWSTLFPTHDIVILTGDYELTEKQKKELKFADIIIMTYEMLNSRCTKFKTEQNNWLKDVGTLIVDEAHLISSPGRGDKLEVSIMQFTFISPSCQILLLSATLSHLQELVNWITLLTDRKTILIESTYRPCALNISHHEFNDYKGVWDFNEKFKVTIDIINKNPLDKYIVFCSSRKDSKQTAERLHDLGYKAEFHNATLTLNERKDIERQFREKDLQIISATPTLAVGVNMPAKRVIIQSVFRGLNEISSMEVQQCCGRAGRPKYDTEGYAHIILPRSQFNIQKARIRHVELTSVLSETRDLLFHLNNQIYMGEIQTEKQAMDWWKRTFAFAINQSSIDIILHLGTLKTLGFVEEIGEDKLLRSTKIGKISAMLYHYPDDVLIWKNKFNRIVKESLFNSDIDIAQAMVSMTQVESAYYIAKDEKPDVDKFISDYLPGTVTTQQERIHAKYAMHNFWALTDKGMKSVINNIRRDSDRIIACIQMIDAFHGWEEKTEWDMLSLRIKHGVPRNAVGLVRIQGVGRKRALALLKHNIHNANDIIKHDKTVKILFGYKIGNQIIKSAKYITGKKKIVQLRM